MKQGLRAYWFKSMVKEVEIWVLLESEGGRYVTYDPVEDRYGFTGILEALEIWDWQIDPEVFSKNELDRFFLRLVDRKEFETLDKKYNLLELF